MSAAANEEPPDKKQKTDNVVWPTIDGVVKICDGVEKPILQTLATVCAKLYDEALFAAWTPADGKPIDDQLAQAYELSKPGGEYNPGGTYKQLEEDGKPNGKYEYLNGDKALVFGYHVFNENTAHTASLASYGNVVGGFTDFHGMDQATIPPFAALVVQPNDETEAPILILAWRGSVTVMDWINDVAFSPTLSSRWSSETDKVHAHGAYTNLVENTLSLHEPKILDLFKQFPKVKCAYITGHSLGGGIANVAHLVVRAQLKKKGSPWYKLVPDKVSWLSCTFASPQTLVRKYDGPDNIPPLVADLDASSYNVVYECDMFPRILGMLKYLGDFIETVAPKVVDDKINHFVSTLGIIKRVYVKPLVSVAEDKLQKAVPGAVKFLKNKGLTEVVAQFTHTGTVVYLAPEATNYVYLLGKTKIHKVLDVDGEEFKTLLGNQEDYAKSLTAAHGHSYNKFVFSAK